MGVNYLYGAAVQGIQSFIFQTNELKDIVGASELVEQICTTAFDEYAKGDSIVRAAGNIKHIFFDKEDCEKAVREFPKKVMNMAPGISISQAVVKMDNDFALAVEQLESKLRAQRNRPMNPTTIGLMGMQRSRKTGLPVVVFTDNDYLDDATYKKRKVKNTKKLCEKCFNIKTLSDSRIAYNIEDITNKNDWIAIIHADGNGLGQIVQKIGKNKEVFGDFSRLLDKASVESAHAAFEKIIKKHQIDETVRIPIRPIVLGGDDLTVICRGDIAIAYVTEFLSQFEVNTKAYLGEILSKNKVFGEKGADYLTACAGVAFIKSSYPFYYGCQLAESLCAEAKKDAKMKDHCIEGLASSCLLFHKVQDSFVEDYSEIVQRELTPCKDYSFKYGPYYINKEFKGRLLVSTLLEYIELFNIEKAGNAVKSHLRKWMSLIHKDKEAAEQKRLRILEMISNDKLKDLVYKVTKATQEDTNSPVYDMLALHTIINQNTNKEED